MVSGVSILISAKAEFKLEGRKEMPLKTKIGTCVPQE